MTEQEAIPLRPKGLECPSKSEHFTPKDHAIVFSVYLAGPMRGLFNHNFSMFLEVGWQLHYCRWSVHNPAHEDLRKGFRPSEKIDSPHNKSCFSLSEAFRDDINAIIQRDGIVLLPGWQESKGASMEYVVAKWTGRRVWEVRSWERGAPEKLVLRSLDKTGQLLFEEGIFV